MSKFKRIIEFILALLNFLFHFKPSTDDKTAIVTKTYPSCPAWHGKGSPCI